MALPDGDGMRLAPVEGDHLTLPTAIFFNNDEETVEYGRAALASYIDGFDGRLMRSMKSILGSPLAETTTDLGDGSAIAYTEIIARFLTHLKRKAEARAGAPIGRAVLGRPVFFVDDDPRADRLAQDQLEAAARSVGFADVQFQYEPIAAAFDYESRQQAERLVLVADIGGGTSDFSLVRVGPNGWRGSSARTTCWPTTACTSRAPITTGVSSWRRSCPHSATVRSTPKGASCRTRSTSISPPGT